MTFDTGKHDPTTGTPTFLNGSHDLSAELQTAGGMMANGMMGHEIVYSNVQSVRFSNKDGVRIVASAPGEPMMNPQTGDLWYGGPAARDIAITAVPVIYSGRSVESVTALSFCGADAASDDSAPYEFALVCDNSGGDAHMTLDDPGTAGHDAETPRFTMVTGGESRDDVVIVNNGIFPIRLDYRGPDTRPIFKVSPNGREPGWINAAVKLVGRQSSTSNPDGWLTGYASDESDPGVGGYTPQLRYSTTDPSKIAAAKAAEPSSAPTLPAETGDDNDKICFIASAVDLLGNESSLPSTSSTPNCGHDGRSTLAGVDITLPTATLTSASLRKNPRTGEEAREIGTREFIVEVDDGDGSGIHEGMEDVTGTADVPGTMVPRALVASLEIRDAEATKCVWKNKTETSARLCEYPFDGITPLVRDIVKTTSVSSTLKGKYSGYFTFTAQAQDKAGNLSEELSAVALNDERFPARPSVRVTAGSASAPLDYELDIFLDDDVSIRDYYVTMNFLPRCD